MYRQYLTNLGTVYTTWTSISSNTTNTFTDIPANTYLTIIFSKNGEGNGTIALSTTACLYKESLILMSDYTYKPIKNIKKYDEVITDIKTNTKMLVSKNISCVLVNKDIYRIPKGLLKNKNDIYIRDIHPIWINDNEKCFVRDIVGVIKIPNNFMINELFYNLQFDTDTSFYVEGIKVDSLSPCHRKLPLGEDNFIDKNLYKSNKKINDENDISIDKPILVNRKVLPNEIEIIN